MSNQYLKLRRSAIPGKIPETSSIDFGEIALNTYDGLAFIKKSGSLGEEIVTIGASNISGSNNFIPVFSGSTSLVTSTIFQSGSYTSIRNSTAPEDPTNPDILYVSGEGVDTYNLISAHGDINSYVQINVQNYNNSTEASSDIVATANNGDEDTFYINMGINSEGFTNTGNIGGQNDAYVYSTGRDLYIGNASIGKEFILFNGGLDAEANAKIWIHDQGTISINTADYNQSNPPSLQVEAIGNTTPTVIQVEGEIDGYSQVAITNRSGGNSASADLALYNDFDPASQINGFVDIGINSTNYNDFGNYPGWKAKDSYVYSDSPRIMLGSIAETSEINLFVGDINPTLSSKLMLRSSNIHSMTGSLRVTGSITALSFTGSLLGTSSYAITASYWSGSILNSTSASYAATAALAPAYVLNSSTASMLTPYVLTSSTSSMTVLSSSYASTASYALSVVTSSLTGSFVTLNTTQTISGSKTFSPTVTAISSLGIGTTFAPTLSSSANSNTLVGLELTPTFFTGSYTVGSNLAMRVRGNTVIYGGNDTYDYPLIVNNTAGTTRFSVRNDGVVSIPGNGLYVTSVYGASVNGTLNLSSNGTGPVTINGYNNNTVLDFLNSGVNETPTSGIYRTVLIGLNYTPTSGTAQKRYLEISPYISQSGAANGITRGVYINPTLISAADWRSIETTNNTGYALYLSGSAKSYVSGNFGIGNLSPSYSLDVSGATRLNGNTQITGSLIVSQGITGSLLGTASFATTSSYALTASYWSGSVVNSTSASYADTASFAPNYVLNSSTSSMLTPYVLTSVTASMLSPYVLSSNTSSFITNSQTSSMSVLSASFASTASSAENFTVRGTLTAQTLVVQTITSSIDYVTGSTRFGSLLANTHQFTGSVSITGSLVVNGSNAILTNQTSSMSVATASYVLNAVSASFASTASYWSGSILNATSASFASTASYILNAISASYASTASYVLASGVIGLNLSQISLGVVTASVNTGTNLFNIVSGSNTLLNLSTTGNLGIGTTSPVYKLDVSGSVRIVEGLTIQNNSTSGLSVLDQYGITVFKAGFNGSKISIGGVPLGGFRQVSMVQNGGTTANGGIVFYSDNAETVSLGNIAVYGGQFRLTTTAADVTSQNALMADASNLYLGYYTYNTLPASAALAIQSTTKGFLPPRMTAAQRTAISTPAQGLLVYDLGSATEGLWLYNSGSTPGWQEVLTNTGSQSILGGLTATSFTGSLQGTASWANNAVSASFASTASYSVTSSLPLRGLITGSVAGATLTFTKGDGTTFDLTVAQSGTVSTASFVTSSGVFGPYGANSIVTASYALTASYVANASSFPYTGSAIITGSLTVTGSTSVQSLNVGSSQFNNTSSITSAGTTVISQLATGSYTSCFYNYTIASASNARSGQVMSVWNGVTVKYTEVTTTDIGNTATASFAVALSGANVQLNFTAPGVWTVKNISNLL